MPSCARVPAPSVRFRTSSRSVDLLHESHAEHRRGNAEDEVVVGCLGGEVRLRDVAARRVAGTVIALADDEQRMHAAVTLRRSAVRLKRASRMGPFNVMNAGTVLRAPNAVAMANCGLTVPEVPPMPG